VAGVSRHRREALVGEPPDHRIRGGSLTLDPGHPTLAHPDSGLLKRATRSQPWRKTPVALGLCQVIVRQTDMDKKGVSCQKTLPRAFPNGKEAKEGEFFTPGEPARPAPRPWRLREVGLLERLVDRRVAAAAADKSYTRRIAPRKWSEGASWLISPGLTGGMGILRDPPDAVRGLCRHTRIPNSRTQHTFPSRNSS
jgi:hypothetical protein